jgi:IS30 family transposase
MLRRLHGLRPAAIARGLGRHRSTIRRECARNRAHSDGYYRPQLAAWYARRRRSRSRRNQRFAPADWRRIHGRLREDGSPEQVAGWLRRHQLLRISHETIYRPIWADLQQGGARHTHLRCARRQRRKRSGTYERRGRGSGKRPITARPAAAERRTEIGHGESDPMVGPADPVCSAWWSAKPATWCWASSRRAPPPR